MVVPVVVPVLRGSAKGWATGQRRARGAGEGGVKQHMLTVHVANTECPPT